MIWNNYQADTIQSGSPADDILVLPAQSPSYKDGKLWAYLENAPGPRVAWFNLPLSSSSTEQGSIALTSVSVAGGGSLSVLAGATLGDFAFSKDGDSVWIADTGNSREFRVTNLNKLKDAAMGPYVDVVLGKPDISATSCTGPSQTTLCRCGHVSLDSKDNVYVSDNGGEAGSNLRLLRFDASLFPAGKANGVLTGVPASQVWGTGGSYDVIGSASGDFVISPFKIAIDSKDRVVVTNNPYYTGQNFAFAYLDPTANPYPELALGDYLGYPNAFFDSQDNLYVVDFDWSRILIFRQPLKPY